MPGDQSILAGFEDGTLARYDSTTGERLETVEARLPFQTYRVNEIVPHHSGIVGIRFAIGVMVLRLEDRQILFQQQTIQARSIAISPDGQTFAWLIPDNQQAVSVGLWNVGTGEQETRETNSPLSCLTFETDARLILGDANGNLRFPLRRLGRSNKLEPLDFRFEDPAERWIQKLRLDPGNRHLAVTNANSTNVYQFPDLGLVDRYEHEPYNNTNAVSNQIQDSGDNSDR